jgi:ubiquinone/menaquinone biosynthesis C-methylase UbiE
MADSSEGMLEVLREKVAAAGVENMHSLCLDLARDPLPEERYDLTYSLMVMHHVDDTPQMLGRFHALLEPGGTLCICDLDHEDGSFHNYEFEGHLGFDRTELEKLVRDAGFEGVRFMTVFDIHRHGRIYPLFLMTARKPD